MRVSDYKKIVDERREYMRTHQYSIVQTEAGPVPMKLIDELIVVLEAQEAAIAQLTRDVAELKKRPSTFS